MIKSKQYMAVFQAILAAALFGLSAPVSKLLLGELSPLFMAALLYLGAGIGMLVISLFKSAKGTKVKEAKISKKDLPFTIGMVVLDIAAPIFLMIGIKASTASTASLLNNFEIVATSLIALVVFKEAIGRRLWIAIAFITVSSIILSVNDFSNLTFSLGSIFVLLACICWGFENNCTRMLSLKDPMQIVIVKGFGSGIGALIIALISRDIAFNVPYTIMALLLGFFAYGLSIFFYVTAQRELGAARTSAYYAVAPFIGVILSIIMFREDLTVNFAIASAIMVIGTYYAAVEKHSHSHIHEPLEHEHRHGHDDGHHNHTHEKEVAGEHSHHHTHEPLKHSHRHTPDMHHDHTH